MSPLLQDGRSRQPWPQLSLRSASPRPAPAPAVATPAHPGCLRHTELHKQMAFGSPFSRGFSYLLLTILSKNSRNFLIVCPSNHPSPLFVPPLATLNDPWLSSMLCSMALARGEDWTLHMQTSTTVGYQIFYLGYLYCLDLTSVSQEYNKLRMQCFCWAVEIIFFPQTDIKILTYVWTPAPIV